VQGSLYHTKRTHLVTRDLMGELDNAGRGATYGAELLASVARGPWFGWLAYAYAHSTRLDAPGGAQRLFDYDQPHNLNAALSYRRGRWQVGGRFRLASGMPTTPVIDATYDSDANLYYPVYGAVNSERAPMHHQLDLRIDRKSHWGPIAITQFLDVQNVYLSATSTGSTTRNAPRFARCRFCPPPDCEVNFEARARLPPACRLHRPARSAVDTRSRSRRCRAGDAAARSRR
jgi:hypothetical protein